MYVQQCQAVDVSSKVLRKGCFCHASPKGAESKRQIGRTELERFGGSVRSGQIEAFVQIDFWMCCFFAGYADRREGYMLIGARGIC